MELINQLKRQLDQDTSAKEGSVNPDVHLSSRRLPYTTYFDFKQITRSYTYKKHFQRSIDNDWARDVCDDSLSNVENPEKIPRKDQITVVQKSPTWLYLRAKANGTASSMGKYIPGDRWRDYDYKKGNYSHLNEPWIDKLLEKPYVQTTEATGHMGWGVEYEDLALMSFAEEYNVCVSAVGTIRVDFSDIHANYQEFFSGAPSLVTDKEIEKNDYHLLISPDGIVGVPKPDENKNLELGKMNNKLSSELTGMLEIKCMSPFYHIATERDTLEWVPNMEKRQWYKVEDIPHVYLIQMCLQAISGVLDLDMGLDYTMYFQRWSPRGFSIFQLPFSELFSVGLAASELYFGIIERSKKFVAQGNNIEDFQAYPLTPVEKEVEKVYRRAIYELKSKITHKYHDIRDKYAYYDIFDTYMRATKGFEFDVSKKHEEEHDDEPSSSKTDDLEEGVCLL